MPREESTESILVAREKELKIPVRRLSWSLLKYPYFISLTDHDKVPEDVEAIVIVGNVRGNKSDDTIFSGLEVATIVMRAANKSESSSSSKSSKSSKTVTSSSSRSKGKTPSYYDLAHYTTTHTDVGASGSIVCELSWNLLTSSGFG